MPPDWKARLEGMDALYFGAVGWPASVPDHVSLWESLIKFRREFDPHVNLRPVRLFEGVPCPRAGRKAGDSGQRRVTGVCTTSFSTGMSRMSPSPPGRPRARTGAA